MSRGSLPGWRDYTAPFLTDAADVTKFCEFVVPDEAFERRFIFDQDPKGFAVLLLKVLQGQSRRDILLSCWADLFSPDAWDSMYVPEFQEAIRSLEVDTVFILQSYISGTDAELARIASNIMARMMQIPGTISQSEIQTFLNFHIRNARTGTSRDSRERACDALLGVLRVAAHRLPFVKLQGVPVLADLIRQQVAENVTSIQLLYKSLQILWFLSFEGAEVGTAIQAVPTVFSDLLKVLVMEGKEKNLRLALGIVRNLCDRTPGAAGRFVELGAIRVCAFIAQKPFKDEDIIADLEAVQARLDMNIDVLTSFSRYRTQVASRKLERSPNHTSDAFWALNISKFEEDNFAVVRTLSEILFMSGEDPTSQAVAAHDLGRFIHLHPRGREVARKLKLKMQLMKLLGSPHPEVQKEALSCAQRLILKLN